MMKNCIVYRIAAGELPHLADAEAALAKHTYQEIGATQQSSLGWQPPRGDAHGALIESVAGRWILRCMVETKPVPGPVLARRVKDLAARIEKETGRKPGRKESKELKEQALLDLLPMAFPKQLVIQAYLDPEERLLVIDASTQGQADVVVSLLIESLPPGVNLSLLNTQTNPQAAMSHWLVTQEPPSGFTVDRECELQSQDESKATVRYARHPLDIEEIQAHISAGKLPTKLALTWDDRISLVLTEGLHLKSVKLLDTKSEGGADGFDADWALFTGEMNGMLPDLIEALGGEPEPQE